MADVTWIRQFQHIVIETPLIVSLMTLTNMITRCRAQFQYLVDQNYPLYQSQWQSYVSWGLIRAFQSMQDAVPQERITEKKIGVRIKTEIGK